MKAAVVTAYGTGPRYADTPSPRATEEHEIVVDVLAAGLHPRVRMQADGSHYTSSPDELPLVPGLDGVGRGPDGRLWFFAIFGGRSGSMAEQAVIDTRRSIVLPDGADPVAVAATMNCVIASWLALTRRIALEPGKNVLVLGATGGTGRMAVAVARLFGAAQVTAVGRDPERLAAVRGATGTALIGDPPPPDVDVVLDFLWGEPAVTTMGALLSARPEPARPLTWINLGETAGSRAALPAGALRSSRIDVIGSGQGSLSGAEMAAAAPEVLAEIARGTFAVDADPIPLHDVERAWAKPADSSKRIVLTRS
ncbi:MULTISPECIES: zinc-binding alcohol dehydrogenase family protein [unclassified Saccharopolyspora]|uniref:quinone oxidoreductase family protein n=1 Tax=unclassified Saccharopolyspora TaxID=2646250 RepID=UPI001CD6138A|nr:MULTISPECIES: zinc-binding alcohol dehydrogenase family protein [unclassified Saccharopolyspora]MCA1190197.1 zinc-binding alcohol dehydrogenase family protein [Saccharopolyspora sp. 6T]MCA1192609.1 zinc-binding alcohol dehydrogenase family protein [Saccharopolyspora sp. 6V]